MNGNGPKIPIPGAAGAAIAAALLGLATKPGPGVVTITKKPVAGGGYIYEVTRDQDTPRATSRKD
jgi:hypothetical protein